MERGPRVPSGRVDERVAAVRNALDHLSHAVVRKQGAEGATRRASTYVSGDDSVNVKRAVVKRQRRGAGAKEILTPHLLDTVGRGLPLMIVVHGDAGTLVELLQIADCNAGAGHERGKQLRQFAKEIEATNREG